MKKIIVLFCLSLTLCLQVQPIAATSLVPLEPLRPTLTGPHTGSLIHSDEINDKLLCKRIKGKMQISERIVPNIMELSNDINE